MSQEDELNRLLRYVKDLRSEFAEIKEELSEINEKLEDKALSQEEREKIAIQGPDGHAPNEKIAEIFKHSKVGKGIEVGEVENILETSRKTTLSVMRRMGNSYDFLSFRKGKGNKGSILKHVEDR